MIGVHIIGLHAADLIQECSNAVAAGTTVRELSMMVSMIYATVLRLAVVVFFAILCIIVLCSDTLGLGSVGVGKGCNA